jgi:hypothetical protein
LNVLVKCISIATQVFFKLSLYLIAGRDIDLPSSYHSLLKEKHPLGGSEYWGGLEDRAQGGAVGVGLVIDKGNFWSSFPMFILWLTKNGQCLSI